MKQQNNINELMEKIDRLQNQVEEVQKMIADINASQLKSTEIGLEISKAIENHNERMKRFMKPVIIPKEMIENGGRVAIDQNGRIINE